MEKYQISKHTQTPEHRNADGKKGLLTTHYVIKLDVFKGWNFSLELKRGPIANENSLEAKVHHTG